ncbi:MAG TPA: PRC-barrel domain-containing protein [Rhizomicrobium sp.]|jgi:sporulation protein YlmC with PRC-barrel domain|nr:PRC-barrel domain-containing protein [Rhizomicrobium sp.]
MSQTKNLQTHVSDPFYGNGARRPALSYKLKQWKDRSMTTASGHTSAILASKVQGTNIYNQAGDKIGQVKDIVLDKQSDRILFAALGFGGVLGMGEKFYPVPWSVLDYSKDKGGYVIPVAQDVLDRAPTYRLEDLTRDDGQLSEIRAKSYDYYNVERDW